ncbi:Golgin candidate 5 [Citrus sinensis]|nr:Golgin candidate 5 [Citrus sinensis]
MAWFSGKVSLGNFPDLAGAVNKFSESVKNIEKNFDTALGFDEKAEKSAKPETSSSNEGLWPVMSFMGHKSEGSSPTESSGKPQTPQQQSKPEEKVGVETERSVHSATGEVYADKQKASPKTEKDDEHPDTAENLDFVVSEHGKVDSESNIVPNDPSESAIQNIDSSEPVDNQQQKVTSDLGTSEETESGEAKSGPFEADQIEISSSLRDESDNVANACQSKDEGKKEESNYEEKSQAEEMIETGSPFQAEVSTTIQAEVGAESSDSQSVSAEETERVRELLSPSVSSPTAASEIVSAPVSPEHGEKDKAVEVEQQANDSGIVSEEQRLSSEANVSVSADSVCELEKLKREMKMMETALQGAARQAQAKADEIAKMMNENEHLKAVIEDLKRKTNDAELETLREEYHQRVATLERKLISSCLPAGMIAGEELSKKQAAQEAQIRKLRAQIRELEEEKKGLVTKLQVEENKVESIKRDKTATEKLLQETIEKHQVELGEQKDYYTNALAAAKEAEELAEARANNEARAELESRLREAGERETMLVQALEELRQTLSRTEQQAVFREDMLRRDIEDLQRRYQASERRCEELVTQVPESTRPLLRQIEAIQETTARRAEAWAAVERSLNLRLQEAEAKAAASEERERSVNERLSQTLSRINVLEAQISCLRAEQTQLTKSLEKERQRAAENRQEYLAAKEEADTQEGRANQLEEEIKELRRKHKQELQEALMHRELLQQVFLKQYALLNASDEIEREKTARVDLERRASAESAAVSEKTPIARHTSAFENGSLSRKLSSASSLGSMEESHFLQASLDSSDSLSDRKNTVEPTMSPYYVKSMTPSAFESILRQKEGELASYMSRLASMESIRDSLAEELVKMTAQCEKLRAEAAILPGIQAELDALRRRHSAALELMGERDEELEELRADIMDLKEMYREQVNLLVNKIQVMGSSMGNT